MRRSAAASVATSQARSVRAASAWREQLNPMRNLTMPAAVRMLEAGAQGMYADLQWAYASPDLGIEASDPDLSVIIERTVAGLSECSWQVKTISEETRNFDKVLAQEQEAAIREMYENCKNIKQAWEHLTMARFRGFSHLNPWYRPDGTLERLEPLPQYSMIRESGTNNWAFNPDCRQTAYQSTPVSNRLDKSEYILMQSPRSVNRIGLVKTIRSNTDEKDWDAFIETYGLPGVFVIMPQNIKEDEQEYWLNAAEDAANGGNGVLPNGSTVSTLAEARGSQPFQPRLAWLREQLILVGTGGMLNGLAVSGSGTLAGSVHAQAFREIIRRQAALISECLQDALDIPRLETLFPSRPVLAYFEIEAAKERDTTGVVQNVSSLATAGYFVDPKQVEEDTGYRIILFQPQQQQPAITGLPSLLPGKSSVVDQAAAAGPNDVASTAMNGAQVTALLEIISKVSLGEISPVVAPEVIKAAFPLLGDAQIARMIPADIGSAARTAAATARRSEADPETALVAAARPAAARALAQDLTPLADVISSLLDKSDAALMADLTSAAERIPAMLPAAGEGELEKVIEGTMTAALLNGARQAVIDRPDLEKPRNPQPENPSPPNT